MTTTSCPRATCFYPRHPRGWRRCHCQRSFQDIPVSIHATLAGGDGSSMPLASTLVTFLSTPPSRVATKKCCRIKVIDWMFLSTPPSRVATAIAIPASASAICFYPRHPRGWRRISKGNAKKSHYVSIHATLAGGDGKSVQKCTVSFAQKGKNYL